MVSCIHIVRYEWNGEKNQLNHQKHRGISFELATLVFEDPRWMLRFDRWDETGEPMARDWFRRR